MTRRSPALRALLLASVAAGPFPAEAFAALPTTPREQAGSVAAFPGLGVAQAGSEAEDAAPEGWSPGRQYAQNLTGDVANDASAPTREPVTREYMRYADNVPAPAYNATGPAIRTAALAAPPQSLLANAPAPGYAPFGAASGGSSVQVAQLSGQDAAAQSNPFRNSSVPTLNEPSAAATVQAPGNTVAPTVPADQLTSDIDRDIRQLSNDLAPQLNASVSLRGRTGDQGVAQLFDLEAPVEASFSPNGYGRLKVAVTPTFLFSGGPPSTTDRQLFGTNPLRVAAASAAFSASGSTATTLAAVAGNAALVPTSANSASGMGLDVGYSYDIVSADIGTTPVGFRKSNLVGGIEVAPKISNNLILRFTGERRAVNDSILSFAGLRDPGTGLSWGGVTRNRGHFQVEGSVGTVSYYAGAGIAGLYGSHVEDNFEVEAGTGFSLPVYTTPTQEVRTGLNLVYFGYSRNLGNFSFGNGGYFSPQQFFAALIPVTYRQQLTPDLVYDVGASIGIQTFRAKTANIFPNDPGLQSQLAAIPGAVTRNAGFSQTGPGGGANADIDYRVNDNLHVGAKAGFDRSGNFTEGTGLVYARYVFNDAK